MKYFFLLVFVLCVDANAAPIRWTLEESCSFQALSINLCGDFIFDAEIGGYSDVDILFVACDPFNCYPSVFDETFFFDGDQYFLRSGMNPYLYMSAYDLSVLAPQNFNWSVSGQPITFRGSGRLAPVDLPQPPSVPTAATAWLVGLALACGVWLRRKRVPNVYYKKVDKGELQAKQYLWCRGRVSKSASAQ